MGADHPQAGLDRPDRPAELFAHLFGRGVEGTALAALIRDAGTTQDIEDLPLDAPSPARWLDGEQQTRERWRTLVTARRDHTNTAR